MKPMTTSIQPGSLITRLAQTPEDLRAAQALRYRVFVQEMGGDGPMVDHAARLEQDAFDPLFDHILLLDTARGSQVVGAYRVLPYDRLAPGEQFYSDGEFDLSVLRASGRRLLELGRSCVDPAYRGGMAMLLMWQALAEYALAQRAEILFGAASFQGTDPKALAQPLSWLHYNHLAPPELRTRARPCTLDYLIAPENVKRRDALAAIPPLIRSYLRLGACIGEGAYVDHAFNTTDLCIMLDAHRLDRTARAMLSRTR